MLPPPCIERVPNLDDGHFVTEVIDMPATVFVFPEMPRHASANTARAKGAADVNIVTALDLEFAQSANGNDGFIRTLKNERVCPRLNWKREDHFSALSGSC